MSFLSILLIILTILFVVGVPAVFLIIRLWKFPEITETLVLFEDTGRTGGSAIGNLISKDIGKNGRLILTVLPKDVKEAKPIPVIVEPNKIDIRPKGTWFKEKDVIRVLPNSAEDWFANAFKEVEAKNANTHIQSAQKEGLDRQHKHLIEMGEGEISKSNLQLFQSFVQQILKSNTKEDTKQGRPGSYPAPASGHREVFT